MSDRLRHCGPGADGLWQDQPAGVALGHRRLAVIELSAAGSQPMVSASGRYALVYNGEIYNHGDLREQLEVRGHVFRGRCDTEVLLAAIERWGLEEALRRSVGMFAAALWDRLARRLWLFRDRMGEKPLYAARAPEAFPFASKLGAFEAWPGLRTTLDPAAVAAFFRFGYVPAPLTIWREARKLEPGTLLDLAVEDLDQPGIPFARVRRSWSLAATVAEGLGHPLRASDAEAIDMCERALLDSITRQSIADVPVGVFLSGGLDSSLVLALLQRATGARARTFTVGFGANGYDESAAARRTARLLGAEHTEFRVEPRDAPALLPEIPATYDEPFADPSALPTLILARLARREVTVALSGDGADELFGGYDRYLAARRLAPLLAAPRGLRRACAGALDTMGGAPLQSLLALLPSGLRARTAASLSGDRPRKLATALAAADRDAMALCFNRVWEDPTEVLVEPRPREPSGAIVGGEPSIDVSLAMMRDDALHWLPDDILAKVDRASMAASLEARTPFLDHRVVELAWRLPLQQKTRGGRGKWVLREILRRYLPDDLVNRRKMGFRPPLGIWLRGPLRDWAESLLEPRALARSGLLREQTVRSCWKEHVELGRERTDRLWTILTFQAWLEARSRSASALESRRTDVRPSVLLATSGTSA